VLTTDLESKRLEVAHELAPGALVLAVLMNPSYANAEALQRSLPAAAHALGLNIYVLKASSADDIDAAFAAVVEQRIGALLVTSDPFFNSRPDQFIALAARHACFAARVPGAIDFARRV